MSNDNLSQCSGTPPSHTVLLGGFCVDSNEFRLIFPSFYKSALSLIVLVNLQFLSHCKPSLKIRSVWTWNPRKLSAQL